MSIKDDLYAKPKNTVNIRLRKLRSISITKKRRFRNSRLKNEIFRDCKFCWVQYSFFLLRQLLETFLRYACNAEGPNWTIISNIKPYKETHPPGCFWNLENKEWGASNGIKNIYINRWYPIWGTLGETKNWIWFILFESSEKWKGNSDLSLRLKKQRRTKEPRLLTINICRPVNCFT